MRERDVGRDKECRSHELMFWSKEVTSSELSFPSFLRVRKRSHRCNARSITTAGVETVLAHSRVRSSIVLVDRTFRNRLAPVLATWDIRPKNSSFSENGCPK